MSRIDETIMNKLMPFQREGVSMGIRMNGRCLIADEMGLGKTIQALGIASYYKDDWPLLIVAPSSVVYQWVNKLFYYLPQQKVCLFTMSSNCSPEVARIVIVSYDILTRFINKFADKYFGVIILDESRLLKNGVTSIFTAVERIASKATRIILLSEGLPVSRPIDLYYQIKLLNTEFMSIYEYGARYCDVKLTFCGFDYNGSSNVT